MDVPETSNSSTGKPSYYNEHRDPVYAHMVSVLENKMQTFDSIPYKCQVGDSEELCGKLQVFYCSTKG